MVRQEVIRYFVCFHVLPHGATHFMTGMALGTDIWAAEIVLKLRDTTHPHLMLECVLPFRGQTELWSGVAAQYITRYNSIVSGCDKLTVISENRLISSNSAQNIYYARNQYMVNAADYLLAVYSSRISGGTGKTVRYAMGRVELSVVIDPLTFEIRRQPK